MALKFKPKETRKFLELLEPDTDVHSFYAFHPNKTSLPEIFEHRRFEDVNKRLKQLNDQGYGIYICVNRLTHYESRAKGNMDQIRTVWQEDDDGWSGKMPIKPSLVVNTSKGKYHRYFFSEPTQIENGVVEEFAGVMNCMVNSYGSDNAAKDVSRVLRLPGFYHTKLGLKKKHKWPLVKIVGGKGKRYPWEKIKKKFPPQEKTADNSTSSEPTKGNLEFDMSEAIKNITTPIHGKVYNSLQRIAMSLANEDSFNEDSLTMHLESLLHAGKHGWDDLEEFETRQEVDIPRFVKSAYEITDKESVRDIEEQVHSGSKAEIREIEWLWDGFIPKNRLITLSGEGGTGKSSLIYNILSRETTGRRFPGTKQKGTKGHVLILTDEDDLNDTILPRFLTAGGDQNKIHHMDSSSLDINLAADGIGQLRRYFKAHPEYTIVVLDPMDGYVGQTNTNMSSSLKSILTKVNNLAKEQNVTIIGVLHFNKQSLKDVPLKTLISGSNAWVNSPRIALVGLNDPHNKSKKYLGPVKSNISNINIHIPFYTSMNGNGILEIKFDEICDQSLDNVHKKLFNKEKETKKMVKDLRITSLVDKYVDEKGLPAKSTEIHNYVNIKSGINNFNQKEINNIIRDKFILKNEGNKGYFVYHLNK